MKIRECMARLLLLVPMWGCLASSDEPAAGDDRENASAIESDLAGTAFDTITFTNNGAAAVTSSGVSFAGTVSPSPAATVGAGQSNTYVETGVGNVTSFHIDYSAGGKKCHFDSASFPNGASCTFTKNALSQGSAFATCTATLTAFDLQTCSQSVSFTMR